MRRKVAFFLFTTVILAFANDAVNGYKDHGGDEDDERSIYRCFNGCNCILGDDVKEKSEKCFTKNLNDDYLEIGYQWLDEFGWPKVHEFKGNFAEMRNDFCSKDEDWKEGMFNKTMKRYLDRTTEACKEGGEECQHLSDMANCLSSLFEEEKKKNKCGYEKRK